MGPRKLITFLGLLLYINILLMYMITCPFCNKELKPNGIAAHLNKCKKRPLDLSKVEIRKLYFIHNFGENIFSNVINDYNNLFSLPMLKEKYGLCYRAIYEILDMFNIPHRDMKTSQKLITAPKYKEYCNKHYGVDNVSQLPEVQRKKESTFLKHYGKDNVWKTDMYKEFTSKRWASYSPERKNELLKQWRNASGTTSKLESTIAEYLIEINIPFIQQFKFNDFYHPYDFLLTGTNIIIEVNGDFWHANPKMYKDTDILNFPNKSILAKDIWETDDINEREAIKNGYKVCKIWENDIKTKSKEEIQLFILDNIN